MRTAFTGKRLLAALLCAALLCGLLPVGLANAEDNQLLSLYDGNTTDTCTWFINPSYPNNYDFKSVSVAETGNKDIGSLHFVSDGTSGSSYKDLTVQIYPKDMVPGETYTLTAYLKGSLALVDSNNALNIYDHANSAGLQQLTTPGQLTYGSDTEWEKVERTFTASSNTTDYWRLNLGQYTGVADLYVDNITLTDSDGVDHLGGAGSFCTVPAEDPNGSGTEVDPDTLLTVYEGDPGTYDTWYWVNNKYAQSDAKYTRVVATGNKNNGSIHFHNDRTVTEDLEVRIRPGNLVSGTTYTLTLYLKGSLTYTSVNDKLFACFESYESNTKTITTAGKTTYASWTKIQVQLPAVEANDALILRLGQYTGVVDFYIDNITLAAADGVDMLGGAGSLMKNTVEAVEAAPAADTAKEGLLSIATGNTAKATNQWYVNTNYPFTETRYIEIAETGYNDAGSMHWVSDGAVVGYNLCIEILPKGLATGETYTLTMYINGSIPGSSENDHLDVLEHGNNSSRQRISTAGKTTYEWDKVELSFTILNPEEYFRFDLGQYTGKVDFYIDNITLTDTKGNDMLEGVGNFCSPVENLTILPTATTEKYQWFLTPNGNGVIPTMNDLRYVEIAEEGATTPGSLHYVNCPGQYSDDIWLGFITDGVVPGDYIISMKVKGSVTSANQSLRFVDYTHIDNNDFNIAKETTKFEDWTDVTFNVTTTESNGHFRFVFSKWNNASDFYIDDVKFISKATGEDLLQGYGHFSTTRLHKLNESESAATSSYQWYWAGTVCTPATSTAHYMEIVRGGMSTPGALHIVNNAAASGDMRLGLKVNTLPAGTYTVKLKVKGHVAVSGQQFIFSDTTNRYATDYYIAKSTTYFEDWTDISYSYESTGDQTFVIRFSLANGVSDVYLDDIEVLDADGEDMLRGAGHFSYSDGALLDSSLALLDFNDVDEDELPTYAGSVATDSSAPTLTLVTDETELAGGMKATWSYDGTNPSYLHRYNSETGGWGDNFIKYANNYRYLRVWVSNPSHVSIYVSLKLTADGTAVYFDSTTAKLIRKDGTQVYGEPNDESGYGENSCISIPKQFEGWLTYTLDTENLLACTGYTAVLEDFSDCTALELDVRKIASTDVGDVSSYYYVLDELVLSQTITGTLGSTEDSKDYADYDTSVKGEGEIKNVIFMIGDGMGYGALDAARLTRETLNIDTIVTKGGVKGEIATTNIFGEVTDSAAAGTALSTGFLTQNSVLGLTKNYEPVMNLSEWLMQLGKKVGLVTTTYVVDATPAAFAAHTTDRGNYVSIAKDMYELGVDVIMGGGRNQLSAKTTNKAGEQVTAIQLGVGDYGYQYATTVTEMNAITSGKLLGLYQDYNMSWAKDNVATDPTLSQMTAKTFELLENENGFFAMIEGGAIDIAGHDNNATNTQLETLAFDDAVKVAMDYVDANPDTLLIVTADHETGAVDVVNGNITYSSISHTDELVPYYVYGAGAAYFENLSRNTDVPYAIRKAVMGDTDTGATAVPTVTELTDTDSVTTAVSDDDIITYTAQALPGSVALTGSGSYAVVKYKSTTSNLVGQIDDTLISYACDGLWHVSDVLALEDSDTHTFTPLAYVSYSSYNSIEIAGSTVEIEYVAFFDSYESAAAFQATAALDGAKPVVKTADSSLFLGATVTLGDDLDLNFRLDIPDAQYTAGMKVTFTLGGTAMPTVALDAKEEGGYYLATVEVPVKDMTTPVVATVVSADGQTVYSTLTYTIKEYAEYIIADVNNVYTDDAEAAAKAMLTFGGYAQVYFDNYRGDDLANATYSTALSEADLTGVSALSVSGAADGYLGATLMLKSKTAVRLNFSKQVTGSVNRPGTSYYYVQIGGIGAAKLGSERTETIDGSSYTFSVLSFAKAVIEGDYSTEYQNLMKAMVIYANAAQKLSDSDETEIIQ